jgi:arginyl-tRNA synthetase
MFFSPETLPRIILPYIHDRNISYGHDISQGLVDPKVPDGGRKKVIVEFSSPNIAKYFDGNHLRSTLLGAFISNVYSAMGWDVVRLNYLGDWGKHIGLLAAGFERFGSDEKLQQDKAAHLLEVYTQLAELFRLEEEAREKAKQDGLNTADIESKGIFSERDSFSKRMEDGDEAALVLWKRFRDVTIDDLNAGYERLGIRFDEFSGESGVPTETIHKVETMLKEKGALEESDGSWMIDFAKHSGKKGLGTQIVRGRDGATRYLSRDIAAAVDRSDRFSFDKMVYVVSSKQDNHFQQVFTALELAGLPDLTSKLQHVNFGPITGLEDKLLGDILDRCEASIRDALDKQEESSEPRLDAHATAIAVLLAQDMSGKRGHGYSYELDKMALFGPSSGHALLAAHTKLTTLMAELQSDGEVEGAEPDFDVLEDDDSANLLRILAQYPDALASTYKSLEPHTLLGYLFKIHDALMTVLVPPEADEEEGVNGDKDQVKGEHEVGEEEKEEREDGPGAKKAKFLLFENTQQVLGNGMRILGFKIA